MSFSAVTYVDSSAVQALKELYQEYNSGDIQTNHIPIKVDVYEWCFVRVHDAVQVCLQHVPTSNSIPRVPESTSDRSSRFLEKLGTRRKEDLSTSEMESGDRHSSISKDANPQLEPLLSRISH